MSLEEFYEHLDHAPPPSVQAVCRTDPCQSTPPGIHQSETLNPNTQTHILRYVQRFVKISIANHSNQISSYTMHYCALYVVQVLKSRLQNLTP